MGEKARVSKLGPSLVIPIPDHFVEQWGLQEGSTLDIAKFGDQLLLRKKSYNLEELVAQIDPDNLHPEIDFGSPQGNEVW